MKTVTTRAELRAAVAAARARDARVGLVPTMGYLHEGHLALVDAARASVGAGGFVVMSVFVNPLQFGPGEDLDRYPRDLPRDAKLAAGRGVSLLFAPTTEQMYPAGEPQVHVVPGAMADRLCGAFRPGHFRGVLTVVAKLLNLVQPDVAVFGRKDFQQATLIRRMVRDLDVPVEIVVAPTVRESDGLALSSRNLYLSPPDRQAALALSRALAAGQAAFAAGERDAAALLARARAVLDAEPRVRLQYLELADPDTLEPAERADGRSVLAVAAHLGATRLIDNAALAG